MVCLSLQDQGIVLLSGADDRILISSSFFFLFRRPEFKFCCANGRWGHFLSHCFLSQSVGNLARDLTARLSPGTCYFWLLWVFVAVCGVSLVVVHMLLLAAASLVGDHGL